MEKKLLQQQLMGEEKSLEAKAKECKNWEPEQGIRSITSESTCGYLIRCKEMVGPNLQKSDRTKIWK